MRITSIPPADTAQRSIGDPCRTTPTPLFGQGRQDWLDVPSSRQPPDLKGSAKMTFIDIKELLAAVQGKRPSDATARDLYGPWFQTFHSAALKKNLKHLLTVDDNVDENSSIVAK